VGTNVSSRAVYRRVGVASTFSPRFLAVLAEAGRISRLSDASLELIHADTYDTEKERRFREALERLGLDRNAPIHFQTGEPVHAILEVRQSAGIDLLIAGALERETVHRSFTGNVARELLRQAPCDLFLFIEPKEEPRAFENVYVAIPDSSEFSRRVYHRALDLAEDAGAQILTLVHVQTTFAEAKEKASGSPATEDALKMLIKERESSKVELDYHLVRGNTGFTAFEFIQSSGSDLLVMPSQFTSPEQPVFAPVLDWIIQVIPTNLWVIREII
jgi:nucleotide-binding universal stress UspA family protein